MTATLKSGVLQIILRNLTTIENGYRYSVGEPKGTIRLGAELDGKKIES